MKNIELPTLLSDVEVERATNGILKVKTLRHWRMVDGGPKYYKVGRRCLYPADEIASFILADRRGGGAQ